MRETRESGFGVMVLVFFFLILFTTVVFGISAGVVSDIKDAREYSYSRQAFYTAQAGVEDVLYRLNDSSLEYDETEVLALSGERATTSTEVLSADEVRILSRGKVDVNHRNISVLGTVSSGTAFGSGVQAGAGGFTFTGGTKVNGNVYSNGPVVGNYRQEVTGSVVSAGPDGYVDNVESGGDMISNEIVDSNVGGDAYYQDIGNTIVFGTKNPGSPDKPLAQVPISDAQIEEWKTQAENGGVWSELDPQEAGPEIWPGKESWQDYEDWIGECPFDPSYYSVNIGNIKIDCDANIASSGDVTLTGPVWVDGDINLGGGAVISIDEDLGKASVPLIADEAGNENGGGVIDASGGLEGSGVEGSYLILISQNRSAENGGNNTALDLSGGAQGNLILYAPHGKVTMSGGVDAHQITGYLVEMTGGADVNYEDGLRSVEFAGAQGRWEVRDWKEVE